MLVNQVLVNQVSDKSGYTVHMSVKVDHKGVLDECCF